MRVKEAAGRLEVSAATVYSLVASGKLRCVRIGVGRGAIRILDSHIEEFLAGAEQAKPVQAAVQVSRLKHIRL